jgi:uncharacterized protein YutE (UPF0331/DUF86 family)
MNPDKDLLAEDAIVKADAAIQLLLMNDVGLRNRFGEAYERIAAEKVAEAIDAITAYQNYVDPSAHLFWK